MSLPSDSVEPEFGPWNPGIASRVPDRLRPLCTIFRPDHVSTDFAATLELSDLTGLEASVLVAFRPRRLVLHELLVRVTADFSVPDGSRIEDLGLNFRRIVRDLLARYVEPEMEAIEAACATLRRELAAIIGEELADPSRHPSAGPVPAAKGPAARLFDRFARRRVAAAIVEPDLPAEQRWLAQWERTARTTADPARKAACGALRRVVSALVIRHGGLWGDRALTASIATDIAFNALAGERIGGLLEPVLRRAAAAAPYRLLPRQERPVVMNTKGASASGKSTLRPLQKRLAADIGVEWSEFALISPDIWRKQLLDYATLGTAYKYSSAFTGDELAIVDQKLDRYMARKAERGDMSHLLIDRFRFDSFAPDSDEAGSNLLTRFGHLVYLFFMITPPASLVERAWKRGLDVGRYKAVDDILGHGVDAYSGMPELFFTWIARTDKRVHFEFLDNTVRLGERPRTVAFGWNGDLNVLDVKCLLDIERYRRVNVDARAPGLLYRERESLAPQDNARFLRQCVERFPVINFADRATGRIYLRLSSGTVAWADRAAMTTALADPDTEAGLRAAAPRAFERELPAPDGPTFVAARAPAERVQTLGAWGPSA